MRLPWRRTESPASDVCHTTAIRPASNLPLIWSQPDSWREGCAHGAFGKQASDYGPDPDVRPRGRGFRHGVARLVGARPTGLALPVRPPVDTAGRGFLSLIQADLAG